MLEKIKTFEEKIETAFKMRRFWLFFVSIFAALLLLAGGFFGLGYYYRNRVLPGIYIGDVPVGGMSRSGLNDYLETMNDKMMNEGLQFEYDVNGENKVLTIYPVLMSGTEAFELVRADIETGVNNVLAFGKSKKWWLAGLEVIKSRLSPRSVPLSGVSIDIQRLMSVLAEKLSVYETPPVNAFIEISSLEPMEYKILPSAPGRLYDLSGVPDKITYFWSRLEPVKITVKLRERNPVITEADIKSVADKLERVFLEDEILLTYANSHTALEYKWTIGADKIKAWLEVQRTPKNEVVFGLKKEKVLSFLGEKAAPIVVEEAADAKFKMDENGKVMEFQGSRQGAKLDNEKTYQAINDVVWGRTLYDSGAPKSVALQVEIIEPNIKTADVNNLGIGEVLGVGVSDYSRSPTNRIRNITNAVNKLNGVLIKPGEEFSTLKYTGPFTYAGGYFPELVIKGDEVKPEIGGGLCQIGTTLFRMAMNSGMKITNRRNHSLVVFHYNDPVNGNPGTDATVYDPAPDFKFLNDTGNYVLIQTYIDKAKQDLVFTLWGTKDGRQASYSHPVVSRWYSAGAPKDIETDKLEPGKKECQNAFAGADASFVYTRVMPDGKEEKITYSSHYRSLPKICLIGVEKPKEGETIVIPPNTEDIIGSVEG